MSISTKVLIFSLKLKRQFLLFIDVEDVLVLDVRAQRVVNVNDFALASAVVQTQTDEVIFVLGVGFFFGVFVWLIIVKLEGSLVVV